MKENIYIPLNRVTFDERKKAAEYRVLGTKKKVASVCTCGACANAEMVCHNKTQSKLK